MIIKGLIEKYLQEKNKLEEQQKVVDTLNEQIKLILNESENKKYEDEEVGASLVESIRYTYKDEAGIINFLKTNNLNKYIKESIDSKELNKALREESEFLNEGLKGKFTKTITKSLKAEEV